MHNEGHSPAGGPAEVVGRGPGYEVRDTNVKAIVTFVVSLFVFLVLTQIEFTDPALFGRKIDGLEVNPESVWRYR